MKHHKRLLWLLSIFLTLSLTAPQLPAQGSGVVRCSWILVTEGSRHPEVPYGVDIPFKPGTSAPLDTDGIGGAIEVYFSERDGFRRINITRQINGHKSIADGPLVPGIDVMQYDENPEQKKGSIVRCKLLN